MKTKQEIFAMPECIKVIKDLRKIENALSEFSKNSIWDLTKKPTNCGPTKGFDNVWRSIMAYDKKDGTYESSVDIPKGYAYDKKVIERLMCDWLDVFEELRLTYKKLYIESVLEDLAGRGLPPNMEGIEKEAGEKATSDVIFGGFGRPHDYIY